MDPHACRVLMVSWEKVWMEKAKIHRVHSHWLNMGQSPCCKDHILCGTRSFYIGVLKRTSIMTGSNKAMQKLNSPDKLQLHSFITFLWGTQDAYSLDPGSQKNCLSVTLLFHSFNDGRFFQSSIFWSISHLLADRNSKLWLCVNGYAKNWVWNYPMCGPAFTLRLSKQVE